MGIEDAHATWHVSDLIGPTLIQQARQALATLTTTPHVAFQIGRGELIAACSALTRSIERMLADERALRTVACHSYRHDNGFQKIVFPVDDPIIAEVRLHAWHEAAAVPSNTAQTLAANIHNHSADFFSLIALGGLVEQRFARIEAVQPTPAEPALSCQHFACGTRSQTEAYTMHELGRAELSCTRTEQLRAGSVHALRHDVLHRVRASEAPTITVFIQGHRRQTGTDCYRDSTQASATLIDSPNLELQGLRSLLNWALRLLPSDREVEQA